MLMDGLHFIGQRSMAGKGFQTSLLPFPPEILLNHSFILYRIQKAAYDFLAWSFFMHVCMDLFIYYLMHTDTNITNMCGDKGL